MKITALFCIVFYFTASPTFAVDSSVIETAYAEMKTYLVNNEDLGYGPLIVRLSFHDCVSDTCDGCINTDNDSNAGLSKIILALEDFYNGTYDSEMSRADYWQLAAVAAVKAAAISANGEDCTYGECSVINMPDLTYKWGRTDCDDSPYTTDTNTFPDGSWTRSEMMDYFMTDHFSYTEKEVVALMGAHTLGLNTVDDSGYDGPYTANLFKLDNTYYSMMLNSSGYTWTNEETTASKWQFTTGSYTRLNTDLELVYDLTLDSDTSECTCTIGDDCDTASSYDYVVSYAADADTWATDFAAIMEKSMETGYDDLTEYTIANP